MKHLQRLCFFGVLFIGLLSPALANDGFASEYRLDDQSLVLNGSGLRLYGVFGIRVYAAALYLPARQSSAGAILDSDQPKVLQMRFLRNASLEDTRAAWQVYLHANCPPPCQLPEAAQRQFKALLPATVAGETQTYLFRPQGVTVLRGNQVLGHVADRSFARVLLSTWIGAAPTTPELKRALLDEKL